MEQLQEAITHWARSDPVLAELAREHPPDTLPIEDRSGFAALAQAIIHQQVSIAAGRTIWGRVVDATDARPDGFMDAGEARLREAGLSRQKVGYCLDLAQRTLDGRLDFDTLPAMDDAEVTATLTAVKGIGAWSAKMYLIFEMKRPDVCPFEDLGVRLSVERFYGVPEKEAAAWIRDEAQPKWSPYNSLAARVLWHARRA